MLRCRIRPAGVAAEQHRGPGLVLEAEGGLGWNDQRTAGSDGGGGRRERVRAATGRVVQRGVVPTLGGRWRGGSFGREVGCCGRRCDAGARWRTGFDNRSSGAAAAAPAPFLGDPLLVLARLTGRFDAVGCSVKPCVGDAAGGSSAPSRSLSAALCARCAGSCASGGAGRIAQGKADNEGRTTGRLAPHCRTTRLFLHPALAALLGRHDLKRVDALSALLQQPISRGDLIIDETDLFLQLERGLR